MPEETKDEQPQKQTTSELDICPCCRKPTLARPVKPSPQLLDHWMACMVSGVPFTHTYPLYGGRIEVTVGILSADTETKLSVVTSALSALEQQEDLYASADVDMAQLRAMARMCAFIHKVRIKANDNDWREYRPKDSLDMIISKIDPIRLDMLAGKDADKMRLVLQDISMLLLSSKLLSAVPLDILSTVTEAHMRLNAILMNAGFDENFWKGIELG